MTSRAARLLAVPALGACIAPTAARADEPSVSFGVHLLIELGERTRAGIGVDLRGGWTFVDVGGFKCPTRTVHGAVGAFAQVTLFDAPRFTIGAHGGLPTGPLDLDLELGWSYRGARGDLPGHTGLHFGGLFWLGGGEAMLAAVAPLDDAPAAGLVGFGIRFPGPFGETFGGGDCGRPLRVDDRTVRAPCVVRGGRARAARMLADDVARQWLDDARSEAASVPAFEAVARDLVAVGAPRELVRRTRRATADEVRHAQICAAMATRGSGAEVRTVRLPMPDAPRETRRETLTRMALESWRDGCLGEGGAAHRARLARDRATDAATRAAQGRIADDEAAHAELAWDVLAHCLTASREARAAIRATLAADLASPAIDEPSHAAQRRLAALL